MRYIEVRVVDSSGSPEYYCEVVIYKPGILGGRLASGRTDREGLVTLAIDVGSTDQIEVYAKGAVRWKDYPRSHVQISVG